MPPYFAMMRRSLVLGMASTAHPAAPGTLLERPALAGEVPSSRLAAISRRSFGIPILVLAGITRRWALRAVIAVVALALVAATAIAFAPPGETDPLRIVLAGVRLVAIALALYLWGRLSGWSWLVAALVFGALGGLRSAVYAPTGQEQVAGALTVVAASVFVALIVRHARERSALKQDRAIE